jgi:hypothetical protein
VLAALIAWVPLALLAAAEGHAIGPTPQESMLLDVAAHARYLVALPLLVLAESVCLPGLGAIARFFGETGLIAGTSRPRYLELMESTRRLLLSPRNDISILLLAVVVTVLVGRPLYQGTGSTWVTPASDGIHGISFAGWWRALVSQPLYLLLLLGWVWRIALWARLLYGVSRLELNLIPAHPDRAAGLAFTGLSIRSFFLLAFALSVPIAGAVAQEIIHEGRSLTEFKYLVAGVVIADILLFTAPLFVFSTPLWREKTRGIFQYGALATVVGQEFERRWLKWGLERSEMMETPDFSAASDLFAITANVHELRLFPVSSIQVALLAFTALLPFVPVVLLTVPLKEILQYAAKLVL